MSVNITNILHRFEKIGGSTLLNGLLGYWSLDESSGTLYDSHTTNVDLTQSGFTLGQAGKLGNCVLGDGTQNDHIGEVDAIKPTAAISAAAWIRFTDTTQWKAITANYYWGGTGGYGWDLMIGDWNKVVYWNVRNGTSNAEVYSGDLGDGNWHLVIGTFDGTTARLYVDNSEVGTPVTWANTIVYDGNSRFCIGNRYDNDTNVMIGNIDEVSVWDRAINSTERSTLWNGGAGSAYINW